MQGMLLQLKLKYHNSCQTCNVTSVLRRLASIKSNSKCLDSAEIAAEVDMTEETIRAGKIPAVSELELYVLIPPVRAIVTYS